MSHKLDSNTRILARRPFLIGAGASVAAIALNGIASRRARANPALPRVGLGAQPAGLPVRQHAWTEWLRRDQFGNPIAPRFDRLLVFCVSCGPPPGPAVLR